MKRYRLLIAYDGTAYCGWQVQASRVSIQSSIQEALQIVLQSSLHVTGSGRTDAGVHAAGQTAHFDTASSVDPNRLRISLNALLPSDIRILSVHSAPSDFHARYSATSKIYHYHLHLHSVLSPLTRLYQYAVPGPCHLDKIAQAIPFLLGTHDFTSFANQPSQGSASKGAIRTLKRIDLVEQSNGVRLEFEANGFLYRMVRNLTGTLLQVGRLSVHPDEIPSILAAKDRRKAHASAPAHGLCLMQVNYTAPM